MFGEKGDITFTSVIIYCFTFFQPLERWSGDIDLLLRRSVIGFEKYFSDYCSKLRTVVINFIVVSPL